MIEKYIYENIANTGFNGILLQMRVKYYFTLVVT